MSCSNPGSGRRQVNRKHDQDDDPESFGEVRPVSGLSRRLSEAARLGFRTALIPRPSASSEPVKPPAGMRVVEVSDIADALAALHTMISR